MALRDLTWGYCCHCHREEEVADALLAPHRGYDGAWCAGSDTEPTTPPQEGTVSVLTVSPARRPEPCRDPRSEVQDIARDARRRLFDIWRR